MYLYRFILIHLQYGKTHLRTAPGRAAGGGRGGGHRGLFAGDGAGNYGWQKPITREATAQIIYNLLEAAGMLEKLPDVK